MKSIMLSLLSLILFAVCSCEKKPIPQPTVVKTIPPAPKFKRIEIGEGNGNLVIDGATLALSCHDTIVINPGSYNSIAIRNIESEEGCNIVITNKGIVKLDGDFRSMGLRNLNGVTITGNGDPNVKYGFQFMNNVYRAVSITQPYNAVTLQYVSFTNIKDYGISANQEIEYQGTKETCSRDLKFLHMRCEKISTLIVFAGNIVNDKITGYTKGVEIANIEYSDSNNGSVAYFGNAEDYDIHNNRIDNMNMTNNNHNGIFHIRGNGKFHDNFISNHQGNAIRAWLCTVGSFPKDVLIYNNIVVNSRKHSAFEVQSFKSYISSKATFAHALVYNNTCGNMNTSKNWYGSVLDIYDLQGGTCKVFNNLGFNFPAPNPADKINNQQSSTLLISSNNLYFENIADVGFASELSYTLSSTSTAKNTGKSVRSMVTDYYGVKRSRLTPSIGAVE